MNHTTTIVQGTTMKSLSICALAAGGLLATSVVNAAVPGITPVGAAISLTASDDYISQPDGAAIYSFGYGCTTGSIPSVQKLKSFNVAGATGPAPTCPLMQLPGPTLILTEGQTVTVTLTNKLPIAAGNTSIIFSGLNVTVGGGAAGLRTREATHNGTVTYTFTPKNPGTYAYYSGTQSDLQIEMGLYGAVVVLPSTVPSACTKQQGTFALAKSAYDHNDTCYDREYLFQFSEIDGMVHDQVLQQVHACPNGPTCPQLAVTMEPYRPNYFLVNGRSMPDLMDTPFAAAYPHQPYNGNPQMHPGENLLMRVIGQGRWQHPFHFHGNHARVLARDGNMLLSDVAPAAGSQASLAGPLLFTIPTVSGQSVDAIFNWTGQGLNWDVYGTQTHQCNTKDVPATPGDPTAQSAGFDPITHEYCPDHGKPIPVTPPDPQIVANGQWYGGTPYLGLSGFNPVNLPPGTLNSNPGAGYAYMWHSHNEREITTNDVFPGGMMMMMIIDPPAWPIDETL